ncbi:hypothetical protein N7486_008108 [Penicillium sp. IBT 16267x]|nr:hypothetical protein N7486_008108 [Penicillium sp. IBT 16267x]
MQYKTLATLLFATAAIAAPKPQDATAASVETASQIAYNEVPSSIESVLMTGIPSTWINNFYTNSDFQMSEISAMQHGDYPAWVTSLPSAVEAYFTSEIQVEISQYTSEQAAMSTGDVFTVSGSSSGSSTALTTVTPTGTETTAGTSSTGSSSNAASTGASSSGASSSGAASSTSTGGAAAATGGLVMSLAGAAGILGVAFAL